MKYDHNAEQARQNRERLEKVALSILSGMCANNRITSFDNSSDMSKQAINTAKEFIKQLDEMRLKEIREKQKN